MIDSGHRVVLEATALTTIRDHAARTYPDECCGALIGDAVAVHVVEALPLPNSTQEGPRRRFLVRPADYRESERRASACRLDLLGFYHSHPDHPARPSEHDLAQAWPNFHYIIVSVMNGTPVDLRSWRLSEDRSAFMEVAVAEGASP
jgi:proteasome lid subunit RPN8/RPN11